MTSVQPDYLFNPHTGEWKSSLSIPLYNGTIVLSHSGQSLSDIMDIDVRMLDMLFQYDAHIGKRDIHDSPETTRE